MNKLDLYHADYSTCSQKVRLALEEKKLAYESHALSFRKEEQLSPEYLKINPHGVVPTLVHDGEVITDSSSILEYLDEAFPDTQSLSPSTPLEKARMRGWLRYMEEVPTTAIRMPSFQQIFLPALRLVKTEKSFEKSRQKRTLRKGFYGKMQGGKGFSDEDITNAMGQLRDTVLKIESSLEQGPWLLGDEISLVDISLVPLIDRAEDIGLGFLWQDKPQTTEWLARLQQRPAFAAAFYHKSRLSERLEFKLAVRSARKANAKKTLQDYGLSASPQS